MIELESTAHFDFGSAEYRALFARAGPTAFQHPDWLTPFYRHLVRGPDIEPLIVVGRSSSSGELLMVVPLLRRRAGSLCRVEYAFLGVTDYACPILLPEIAPAVADERLPDRFRSAVGPHDVLRIEPVRQEHLAVWRLLTGAAPRPMDYGAHAVELGAPFRPWRKGNLGARRAAALDRKARRLAERGALRLDALTGKAIGDALVKARDFRKGRFPDDPIQQAPVLDFYRDVAMRGEAAGLARTYELSCAEGTIAVVFGLADGESYRYLVLGCDYAGYGKHSPGLVALDLAMAHWAESGGGVFDFTVGDEPFKAAFACRRTPMFRLQEANTKAGTEFLAASPEN